MGGRGRSCARGLTTWRHGDDEATWAAVVCALLMVMMMVGWGGPHARAEPWPCRDDESLSEAAASLLLGGGTIAASQLLSAARAQGFDGVAVHAREGADEEGLRAWLARLGQAAEGVVTCGEARSEHRRLVLASVRGGRLWRADPGVRAGASAGTGTGERARAGSRESAQPRTGVGEKGSERASRGESARGKGEMGAHVRGELEPGFGAPSLVIESADQGLVSMPVTVEQLGAGIVLPADARRVQLVAESASGPRPVAELALEAASSSMPLVSESVPRADAGAPQQRPSEALLSELIAFRRAQSAGALRTNRLLAQSAQRHAERVCELGKLAHRLEGEDPELRLQREHVAARGVGEVLARAESSDAALRALLASASHRLALSRREFTDVGIGQAADRQGQVCLVVLLASWPRRIP